MAIDDPDIDQVLAALESRLIQDDPELVDAFGALHHPSLIGADPDDFPGGLRLDERVRLRMVRRWSAAVMALVISPGIALGDWAPLQALLALGTATLLVLALMAGLISITGRSGSGAWP